MALRHGFKTEARALATELRSELGLDAYGRLDPHVLAEHLAVPIMRLSDLTATCSEAQHFVTVEPEVFSAVTVFSGHERAILHNDAHSPLRQNSNITHELAHCVLHHEPAPALDPVTGCRDWRGDHEDEANWLTGELLVTPEMALATARGRLSVYEASQRFGASLSMMRYRMNVTGARLRANRERARRHRRAR